MGHTRQSRISRQAHEPNCVQTGLALMLFQTALPSLVPAATAVTLCVLVDVHAAWYMLLSMRSAATNCLLAITVLCATAVRELCAVFFCLSRLQQLSMLLVCSSCSQHEYGSPYSCYTWQ